MRKEVRQSQASVIDAVTASLAHAIPTKRQNKPNPSESSDLDQPMQLF